MDTQLLNDLSYKELQGKAKQYNIPANQKKEILIAEIVTLGGDVDNDENSSIQANKSIIVPTTPSAKPSRVTRSTVKKAQVRKEEIEIDSLTEQVESLKVEPVVEKEIIQAPISPVKDVVAPMDSIIESPMASEEPVSVISATPTPCEEAFEEEEEVEFPTPTKLFENNETVEYNEHGQKISINRHVYFTSPDGKGNVNELAANQGQKHMHFASPELQMGKGVHWRYEDYSTGAADASEEITQALEQEAEEQAADQQQVEEDAAQDDESVASSQPTRMKMPVGHNDRVMSFWLTKAFANPIGNFFK